MKNTILTLATTLFLLASCEPKVTNILVTDIVITPDHMSLFVGGTPGKISVEVLPADATLKLVELRVVPEGVVTIDDEGTVTPVGPGTAIITATALLGDATKTCTVTVRGSNELNDTYTGTMWVAPDTDNAFVLEDVEVKFTPNEGKTTADIEMMQVKFAEGMPMRLNMVMSGVALTSADNKYNISGDDIIPTAMNGQQFPQYTITDLTGTVDAQGLEFEMTCGQHPVRFISPAPSVNDR